MKILLITFSLLVGWRPSCKIQQELQELFVFSRTTVDPPTRDPHIGIVDGRMLWFDHPTSQVAPTLAGFLRRPQKTGKMSRKLMCSGDGNSFCAFWRGTSSWYSENAPPATPSTSRIVLGSLKIAFVVFGMFGSLESRPTLGRAASR